MMNSGDLYLASKSKKMDSIIGTSASTARSVPDVEPSNVSGIPCSASKMCSATWPAVQLPSNGTILICCGSKAARIL
ncbi:hypothetical protein D3C86_2144370 [compost metagenome]